MKRSVKVKVVAGLISALVVLSLVVACAPAATPSPTPVITPTVTVTATPKPTPKTPDELTEELYQKALEEGELNLYGYTFSGDFAEKVKDYWWQRFGIKVTTFPSGSRVRINPSSAPEIPRFERNRTRKGYNTPWPMNLKKK